MNNYTVYHCHTMYSNGVTNIDSITNYTDYINRAKECGMTAIGFSEHGSVFSWLKKKEAVEKAGMKYIHAEEFYITETLNKKIRDNYHCVLIAKNWDGVKEINRLSSIAFNRNDNHFYYMPRISLDELIATTDNVMITTACLASILAKGTDTAKERFLTFLIDNKDRCYLEIQHHNVPEQIEYNKLLYEISKTYGIPLIAGTDTHALNADHYRARALLQRAKDVRFENEDKWNLMFMDLSELLETYKLQNSLPIEVVAGAIEETNRMAARVETFDVDRSYKYPHLWKDPEGELWQKINDGIKDRGIESYDNYEEYKKRIQYEFDTYKHNGAIDFVLLMSDVIDYCRANDIQIGWGRGSVNGSVICWLLHITEMDSIKHNLSFERFMNTERVSLADIDTDFPPSRRDEVKEYIVNHKGLHCCDIITFNTIALKGAVRDVCRGLYRKDKGEDDGEYLRIATYICENVDTKELKMRKEYPEVFEYVDLVNGVIVSTGSHPCGMVISATPLDEDMGLCSNSNDPYPISQLYMKEIDSLNYVKLDLLALDTIEVIADTCRLAGIPMVTPDTLDVNDDAVWKSIRDDTTNIFQWEGDTGNMYIKRLMSDKNLTAFKNAGIDVDRMELLTIGNSAIRPAGASYRDDLANGIVRKTGSKAIDDFLSDTFGYLCLQEQIIFFLHYFCGFTMGEADVVRRGFAKKTGTEQFIPRIKEGFIKTAVEKYGSTKEKAEEDIVQFIQVILDASNYLFSRNHSCPYSYEGYAEGWLRYYYPLEFITVALNNCADKEEKTNALIEYAKKVNIPIVAPRFGHSKAEYFCDKNQGVIYKGIGSIKHLNGVVAYELYSLSGANYKSFVDLLYSIKESTTLDSRQLEILIKINFFSDFGDPSKLLYLATRFDRLAYRKSIKVDQLKELNVEPEDLARYSAKQTKTRIEELDIDKLLTDRKIDPATLEKCRKPSGEWSTKKCARQLELDLEQDPSLLPYATKIVMGSFSDINNRELLKYYERTSQAPPTPPTVQMQWQKDYLGYIEYKDPTADPRIIMVMNLDTKFSPKFTAYCLKTGETKELKVHKKRFFKQPDIVTAFADMPFKDGDMLYMKKCKQEPKMRKEGDNWVKDWSQMEWWINSYDVLTIDK